MQFQVSLTRAVAASALTLALGFPATALRAQSVAEGVKMLQYERYESARRILTPLAATDPRASYYLGLAELGLENTAAAQAAFTKYPDDAAALAGQAQVAYSNGNKAEGDRLAAAAADKAKKKDWEPLRFAADAYYRGGEYQRAVDLYNKALERGADNSTRTALGDAYLKLPGGGGQAVSSYEKVTDAEAKNSLAYSRRGAVWYSAKRYDLALENYNKAKEADPENPLPYRDLANAYFYTGKYENARKNIEDYLKYSDKTADDEVQYLNILYLGKDYPAAINKANELIQSGARRPGIYGILAYSQLEAKDSVNALNNARTYLSMQKPERVFPSDYLNMGRIFLLNSMSDSAMFYFDRAIAKDTAPNKTELYRSIAEAIKDRKGTANYKAASKYYGMAAQQPAGSANDHYYWGFYSFYGGDLAAAQTAFDAMEQKFPGTPQAAFWRGRLAAAKDEEGKAGTASPFFESWLAMPDDKAKRSNRDLSIAYQYLALVAYNKGDKAGTEQYLSKITAIEPENGFVKQIRAAQAGGTKKK